MQTEDDLQKILVDSKGKENIILTNVKEIGMKGAREFFNKRLYNSGGMGKVGQWGRGGRTSSGYVRTNCVLGAGGMLKPRLADMHIPVFWFLNSDFIVNVIHN